MALLFWPIATMPCCLLLWHGGQKMRTSTPPVRLHFLLSLAAASAAAAAATTDSLVVAAALRCSGRSKCWAELSPIGIALQSHMVSACSRLVRSDTVPYVYAMHDRFCYWSCCCGQVVIQAYVYQHQPGNSCEGPRAHCRQCKLLCLPGNA